MSRRKRHKQPIDGSGLLLDTLCNALGGVIFIALLVLLISKQITTEIEGDNFAPTPELIESLADSPSSEMLQKRLENITTQIALFSSHGIKPKKTNLTITEALGRRHDAAKKYEAELANGSKVPSGKEAHPEVTDEKKRVFAFPKLKSITQARDAYIHFKNGRFYITYVAKVYETGPSAGTYQSTRTILVPSKTTKYAETTAIYKFPAQLEFFPKDDIPIRGAQELKAILDKHGDYNSLIDIRVTPSGLDKFLEVAPILFAHYAEIRLTGVTEEHTPRISLSPANTPGPIKAPSKGFGF